MRAVESGGALQPLAPSERGVGGRPDDVWWHYTKALLRIDLGDRVLAVQLLADADPEATSRGPWPFAEPVVVLTACNPGGQPQPDEVNHVAQDALEAELVSTGHRLLPAEGRDVDGSWTERSIAVVGMEGAAAVAAGIRHGQRAIYVLDAVSAAVVGCLDAGRVERRMWRSHWEAARH